MRGAAIFAALATLTPMTAAALDCTAPPNEFLRYSCDRPGVVRLWQDMEQALTTALAATPDPLGKAAIQASQDRWLTVMGDFDWQASHAAVEAVKAQDKIKYFEDWKWVDLDPVGNELWEQVTRRTETLSELPAAITALRRLREPFSGGPFSVSATTCSYGQKYSEDDADDLDGFYACGGTLSLQHGNRVCSFSNAIHLDFQNIFDLVNDVRDGQLVHRGNCNTGWSELNCPAAVREEYGPFHWNSVETEKAITVQQALQGAEAAPPSPLREIDPDAWLTLRSDIWPDDWLATCLTTPDYPPPDQLWPDGEPKPTP